MPEKYLIDTSAWVEYLNGTAIGEEVRRLARGGASTHPLVVAETIAVTARRGQDVDEALSSFGKLTLLACWDSPLDWRDAGLFYVERRNSEPDFPLVDAVLYQAARKAGLILLTKDSHFRGLEEVRMLGERG